MTAALTNIRTVGVDGRSIPREAPSMDHVHRSVERVLEETPLCACGTVSAECRAHIHTAYFAYSDRMALYYLSHPGSTHSRNLEANPSMAIAVFRSAQRWTRPDRGVQLFGSCGPASGEAAAEAERIYGQRFPAYPNWKATVKAGDPALAYRLYCFLADDVKLVDEAEFGDAVWVTAEVVR